MLHLTDNLADGFMPGDEWELGNEFSLVYVEVGTADTACLCRDVLLVPQKDEISGAGDRLTLTLTRTSPGRRVGRGTSTIPHTFGFSYL